MALTQRGFCLVRLRVDSRPKRDPRVVSGWKRASRGREVHSSASKAARDPDMCFSLLHGSSLSHSSRTVRYTSTTHVLATRHGGVLMFD